MRRRSTSSARGFPRSARISLVGLVALLVGSLAGCRDAAPAATPEALEEGLARYEAARGVPETAEAPLPPPPRHFRVTVLDGTGVAEMDTMGGNSDVYVSLRYAGDVRETAVDEDTEEPRWHDTFVFPYVEGEPLEISLWDDDPIPQPDQLLGTVTIFPEHAPGFGERTVAFKDGENGTVRLTLELVP